MKLLLDNQLRLTKLQRKSDSTSQEMHTTLNEIIKKIKEILKNIKKERDQFLAIKPTYNRNDFNNLFEIDGSGDKPLFVTLMQHRNGS